MSLQPFRPQTADYPELNSLVFRAGLNTTISDICATQNGFALCGSTKIFTYDIGGQGRSFNNAAGASHTNCASNGSRIFFGTAAGARCYYTDDGGATLTPAVGIPSGSCRGIAVSGNVVLWCGSTDNYLSTDNGTNFSPVVIGSSFTTPPAGYTSAVRYLPSIGLFVVCGSGQKVFTSPNGSGWTEYQLNAVDVSYTDGNVVAVGEYGGNLYFMNTRGNIWDMGQLNGAFISLQPTSYYNDETDTSNTTFDAQCMIFSNGRLYTGHKNSGVQESSDGITFNPYNFAMESNIDVQAMCSFNNELFFAHGANVVRALQG